MQDIKDYKTFQKIDSIDKGWSNDKKYYIETSDGKRLLLRIADISEFDRKESEFKMIKQASALGVPMPKPVDFGTCDGGRSVYSLLTWCDGEDAEKVLPRLTETEQYDLGIQSGRILKILHSIPAPKDQEEWSSRFNRKTSLKVEKYKACGIRFDGDEFVLDYIEKHRHLLSDRPQCYQHGDYHVGNMVIAPDRTLSIIDFNRPDFGDPWEEFNRIVWSAAISPYFATGQLKGYFGGKPPIKFFQLLAFYIASNTLSSIYWAIPLGDAEITTMKNQARNVLTWFDNMKNPIPTWYQENVYVQYINRVPYRLKAPFDMSFIEQYGEVFKVFDGQDSGNICFGVQNETCRYFIKFAGAPTEQYTGKPEDAIARLKATIPVYQDLRHPNLIQFVKAEETGKGYAVIFQWADGECMGRMYPGARQKFLQTTNSDRLAVYHNILSFHAHVAAKGYAAIDFYDGSIMYDFATRKTILCDIDFYSKTPFINQMGRMWGSSRFMSPEEFELGAIIDEVTNVYLMGATAFALFSDYDRAIEKWPLGERMFLVAQKAVSRERDRRQQSIQQFIDEWNNAKRE